MPRLVQVLLAAGATLLGLTSAQCNLTLKASIATADGVEQKLLRTGLQRPRHLVVDTEGNLLIAESGNKGVRRVVLDDGKDLDVCIDSDDALISDADLNHGIALTADGKTILVSSPSEVYAYDYDASKGSVGSRRTVITGMDGSATHSTRTLTIPLAGNPNLLLVAGGSDGNLDAATVDKNVVRSQVRVFDIDELLSAEAPLEYGKASLFGWGLRNSVGWAEDPSTGYIWSVENSVDNLYRGDVDIHNSNPGEEFNFHGLPNDTSSAQYGANYGYPGCFAIYDTSIVKNYPGGAEVGKQMAATPQGETDLGFTDEECQEKQAPRITFGSHLAPLDVKFRDGSAAYISFHGSWNRNPGDGYRVSKVDFANGEPVSSSKDAKAEVPLMWNTDNTKCPSGCFRPAGLAFDKAGRLFMTSDSTGELYVLTGV
ncbi:soluble quino protein glucose/sorbosone dehydrogenase [Fusarium flagelliforme]|uniref:soluble quino protein glucose/sorbosone dehydrogenase n=1 Tax=Fusarium flagelliforme TaxID=2675880 RepID=UPI001E8CD36D|nr:soluble quino protein glucose/sorbosone dehydrogenase [Fusarium flagelliforme]KAH7174920.1 soluble quino protein glucose/sorbosone dehydrogenase [Fusarium flagelliforme]